MSEAIASSVWILVQLYSLVMLARVLMSWIQIDPYSPLARTIYNLTEPVLAPIRNLMPPAGMIDFSPMVAMILLFVLAEIIRSSLGG